MFSAYEKSDFFLSFDKFKLNQYKIDSLNIYSSGNWGGPSAYYVFFDNKKKIKIPILNKNNISFSKRVNKVYKHFKVNTLENDSIYVWEGPTAILYGFKDEKKINLTSYRDRLFFDILMILISLISIFYFIKVEIKKRKRNGNTRKHRKQQKQLKKKEQMKYLLEKMNKKTLIILLYPLFSFSQKEYSNIIFSFSEEQSINVFKYSEDFIIRADYNDKEEAVNEYPEQLIQSVFSATNQEWVNYNTLGGEKKASKKEESHFNRVKTMNKDKNYLELIHKLTFQIGNRPTSIIKFFLHEENKQPVSGAMVLQKEGNRWYKTSNINLSALAIMTMRLKTEVIEGVFLGNTSQQDILELKETVTKDGGVDIGILEKEFFSWYTNNNTYLKTLFIDPKTW
ncbi:hypothetical protein [Tenacibaculum maritimum]|nr:hypothetical protein [Tenacibaculum maritimum]